MIDILINIGSFLLDIFKIRALQEGERDEKIKIVLTEIADLLDEVAIDLENENYPHGKCAQMELLSKKLSVALSDDMDEEYLEMLEKNLNSAVEIERLYAYKEDPNMIEKIRIAAGYYRAAAILASINN